MCVYRELFPSSRCLFLYRDVLTVAKSLYRVSMVTPAYRFIYVLGPFSGRATKILADAYVVHPTGAYLFNLGVRLDNELMIGVLQFAVTTAGYLDMRRRGIDISAVRYEDLVARPLDMCRVVLEFCHLPVSLAELAVKAFHVDSQRNSVIAKSVVGHFKEPQLTPEKKTRVNELLEKFGLPRLGEPDIIEGTLSCC